MLNNLDRYLPDFDEAAIRATLADFTKEELIDRLVYAHKEKRVLAKMFDDLSAQFNKIHLVP
jgi:hypothetical protein